MGTVTGPRTAGARRFPDPVDRYKFPRWFVFGFFFVRLLWWVCFGFFNFPSRHLPPIRVF